MSATADPDWPARWDQLVRAMARVHTPGGEDQLLRWLLAGDQPRVLAFVNAHAMNLAAQDRAFHRHLAEADVVVRDGVGVSLLMQLLNQVPGQNLNGTDFIPRLVAAADGLPIALFGTREPWLARAQEQVATQLAPNSRLVVADGFRELTDYLRIAGRERPRLIVLGMGMPRQEEVAIALRDALGQPCLVVCGGAIIDFLGGKVPRAPQWMRAAGLEWAFRLAREPRRLWDRYVRGNPLFLRRALWLATRSLRGRGTAAA